MVEEFDVLIVGAGISGVGGAFHLKTQRPNTKFIVIEALDSFGGTWWSHRYPGIRSDSDLHTFGYRFKPWTGPPIATADEILNYMSEVITENELGNHIRYNRKIVSANWSSLEKRWEVTAKLTEGGEEEHFKVKFLWMCQGYYRHQEGYMPKWPDVEKYQGELVHSEAWPEELDYEDKEVIVIGSGATAATIIPAMASDCKHITMLQRSPTYFRPGRNQIELAETLRELNIDEEWIHEIVRRKILYDQAIFSKRTFEEPEKVKEELIEGVKSLLPAEFDVETHFTPKYRPWRQRLAYVPDGDLFQGISDGKTSVITDEIEAFTKEGILLKSQQEVKADIIVSATGFNMNVMGDIDFQIDDKSVDFSDTVTYRGMMFTGIPNMLWIFGYFRASWTLRVDLLSDFVCRLLNHMEDIGASCVEVALRDEDKNMELLTWMDCYNFNPGYLVRATSILPKRGDKAEWQHTQDYWREKDEIPAINLNASEFIYR